MYKGVDTEANRVNELKVKINNSNLNFNKRIHK